MISEAKNASLDPEVVFKKIHKDIFGPNNVPSAVISHYLRNRSRHLKQPAMQYGRELIDRYKDAGLKIRVTEDVLRKLVRFEPEIPFEKPGKFLFKFIDLFAGIGGFRMAMQNLNGECVFSSEWDKMAQQTYYANYGEIPFGDITKDETKQWIPDQFDVLCGGFPCQPFSIAGVSKKNSLGRKHGFEDERQGNLFFHVAEIIENKRPKAFFLENVKNLVSHDKGNTFKVIRETLLELGYSFHSRVLNGKHFVPQHRERTFMVGFDTNVFNNQEQFHFPELPEPVKKVRDILETDIDPRYTLTDQLWKYLRAYAQKHKEKGNGFGYGLVDMNGITRTMSARYYKDGSEILIPQDGLNPRRLTIRESARLLGYPDNFITSKVSMNQGYKQFGNSVVMPLIGAIGAEVVKTLKTADK
jgi:DNA (cytosine-5)-methyltransferase 1